MKQLKKRILSMAIVIAMILTDSSIAVFANNETTADANTTAEVKTSESVVQEEAFITNEITDLRTEYSKTYEKSDGTRVSVISSTALHYYDKEDKAWNEFDNTLSQVENSDGEQVLTNNNSRFKVEIPKKLDKTNGIIAKANNYEISILPLDTVESEVKRIDSISTKKISLKNKTVDDYFKESVKSDEVKYDTVYPNTAFEYEVVNNSLKETIKLSKLPEKETSYKFELTAKGLQVELKEDGSVVLKAKNKNVFVIPSPFMVDSNNVFSEDIKTELTKENDKYILSYTPSMEWLSDEARVYPVSIDPTVTLADSNNIEDSFVSTKYPDTNFGDNTQLKMGRIRTETEPEDEYSSEYFSYMKFKNLPENIWNNSYITKATLNLHVFDALLTQINLYEVTSAWDESTVTYNTKPTNGTEIIDYENIEDNDLYYHDWDITNLVEKWYSNPDSNFGVMLKSPSIYLWPNLIYSSEYSGQIPVGYPYITIEYASMTNSTYANSRDIDVGRAGAVNINDFTGNVRLTRNDLGIDGNIMPVNISMIYDQNNLNLDSALITNAYGKGFRTNYSQRILYNSEKEFYTYIGEDARPIYFEKIETEGEVSFVDEADRGFELSVSGTSYTDYANVTITDENSYKYFFDSVGRIVKIADMNLSAVKEANVTATSSDTVNGIIKITYTSADSYLISQITDGIGRVYQFNYDGNLSNITYKGTREEGLRTVTYSYNTDGTLSSVVFPDSKSVSYEWTSNSPSKVVNTDGYHFTFTYTDENLPRVQTVKEYSSDGTLGENINVSYSVNKTTYEDQNTGKKESLQFDKYGNLLTSENGYGYTLVNQYGSSELNTASNSPNELINSFGYQKNGINMLSNTRAQNGNANWSGAEVSTDEKVFGTQSFKLSGTSGTASQSVSLVKDKTYVFSAYVKTSSVQGTSGATIKVTSGDVTMNSDAQYVTKTSDWTRIATTFTANSTCTASMTLKLDSTNIYAVAYFDGIQLEEGTTVSEYDYVLNPDFSDSSNWASTSTQSETAPTDDSEKGVYCFANTETHFDNKCVKLFGDARYTNNVYQVITDLNGQKGDTYNFGGWAKANAAAQKDNRAFGIKVEFYNDEGIVGEPCTLSFNNYITDWQYNMSSAVASDSYTSIKIYAVYDYQVNYALFDRLQLKYTGVSEVEETTEDDTTEDSTVDESSETDTTVTDAHGREIEYTDEDGVKTITAYDDYDNVTRSATQINGKIMESLSSYSGDGNYQISETNALGKTTTYDYDTELGILNEVTYPNGNTVSYGQDSNGNVTVASQGNRTIFYSYDNGDRLTHINSFVDYYFGYDKFGALNNIKLGNQTLVEYDYDDNYVLSKVDYANGQTVNYNYDESGNKLGISSGGSEKYSYYYDDFGTLLSAKDNVNNVITSYSTDKDGIEYTQERKINVLDNSSYLIHSYYNTDTTLNEYVNNDEKETIYTSKVASDSDTNPLLSWNRTAWDKSGGANGVYYNVREDIDEFGRVSSVVANETKLSDDLQTEIDGCGIFTKTYDYTSTNEGVNQSEQVSKLTFTGSYNKEIPYTYDDNGNILTDGKYRYTYDSQNRLKYAYEISAGIGTSYTYNENGNLINVIRTQGPTLLGQETRTYDGVKMTSYNGNNITYDALGNPLTYYNGTQFSWVMGRQLASATLSDGTQISYKYNADGLRTEKVIGDKTISYTLIGSKITSQTDGTNTFYFRYDESDNLLSFELNGNQYFYVTNLVGDIIAILDSNGACMVEYTYDPWGACTILSDSTNFSLGTLNPFRYRGYYYDEETGLYYLQSRYYDPTTCKFINADDPSILLVDPYNVQSIYNYDYCGFNPVVYIDIGGYKWITKLKQYNKYSLERKFNYNVIKDNYNVNKGLFDKYRKSYTYIYGQCNKHIASMKYGFSNISEVGCEIIATYNIMVMLKKKPNFAQIILEFELNNMYFFTSDFGTNPKKLYKYFDAHNVKYKKYTSRSTFCNKMGSGKNKCGIFAYWNNEIGTYKFDFVSGGLHTMAYKYDTKTKKYHIYNYYNNSLSTEIMSKKQFTNDLEKHKFIIGYTF